MKQTLLLFSFFLCCAITSKAQELYAMSDSTIATYRAASFQQTSSALNQQVVVFDDVHVPASMVAGYDSIRITKLNFAILRYAGAPGTTMNVWVATVNPSYTSYTDIINVPPTHVGSISLDAGGASNSAMVMSIGDSVNTLFRVKADTGNYYNNYASFFIGVSFQDTTGSGWILGGSTGNATPNDNVFWRYVPTAATQVSPLHFGGYPRAKFWMEVYGYAAAVLPVTMADFSGQRNEQSNLLRWSTATESNNALFEVQRSADGRNFSTIGKVLSKAENGSSTAAIHYNFTDARPLYGTHYYRLKQVDKDGKFTYSTTVIIQSDAKQFVISNVYPNPVNERLNMVVTIPAAEEAEIYIVDLSGKTVKRLNPSFASGDNNLSIDVTALQKGVYYIKIVRSNGEFNTAQFIKL